MRAARDFFALYRLYRAKQPRLPSIHKACEVCFGTPIHWGYKLAALGLVLLALSWVGAWIAEGLS